MMYTPSVIHRTAMWQCIVLSDGFHRREASRSNHVNELFRETEHGHCMSCQQPCDALSVFVLSERVDYLRYLYYPAAGSVLACTLALRRDARKSWLEEPVSGETQHTSVCHIHVAVCVLL